MYLDKKRVLLAMARACANAQDLAAASGLPPQTINAAIRGRSVRPATLGKIARALAVDPAAIIASRSDSQHHAEDDKEVRTHD